MEKVNLGRMLGYVKVEEVESLEFCLEEKYLKRLELIYLWSMELCLKKLLKLQLSEALIELKVKHFDLCININVNFWKIRNGPRRTCSLLCLRTFFRYAS